MTATTIRSVEAISEELGEAEDNATRTLAQYELNAANALTNYRSALSDCSDPDRYAWHGDALARYAAEYQVHEYIFGCVSAWLHGHYDEFHKLVAEIDRQGWNALHRGAAPRSTSITHNAVNSEHADAWIRIWFKYGSLVKSGVQELNADVAHLHGAIKEVNR